MLMKSIYLFPKRSPDCALGWLLFGLAVLPMGLYPRLAVVLLVVGAVFTWLPVSLSGVPFSVAVIWMGNALLSKKDVSTKDDECMQ